MPIIFISSVPFGGGERLARSLSEKLGIAYLSREDVVARATECGIPVGKLELAMVKKPAVRERLARLKERYLAVATATICEKAAQGDLVYFGRAGQLLLPGVAHVLRVRVLPEPGQRIVTAVQRTKLPREKAERLLKDIDADVKVWVQFVHGVDMDDLRRYDFVVNLENMSVENAASALCGIADLPDFRQTPASRRAMADRLIHARARIALALDERTAEADVTVRTNDGIVTVTYMPRQASLAPAIRDVLRDVPGLQEVRCTPASTNILWIQEEFRPDEAALSQVSELARRWSAAVELLRYRTEGIAECSVASSPAIPRLTRATGGVEDDDVPETAPAPDRAFEATLDALVDSGQSGGGQTVSGGRENLLSAIRGDVPYSLVVVGCLYLAKGSAARTRMTRELASFLASRVKAPVIAAGELGAKLRFGAGQATGLFAAAVAMVVLYAILFTHQGFFLDLLGGAAHAARPWVAVALVAVLAPLAAGLNAKVTTSMLRLLKLE